MKRFCIPALAALTVLGLSACAGSAPAASGEAALATASPEPVTAVLELAETPEPAPAAPTPEAAQTAPQSLTPAARAAYCAALDALQSKHVLPGGTEPGFDESADPSGNRFSIFDVDGDGRDELLLVYTTTFTAGQLAGVYEYDESAGALRAELTEYPLLTFFEGGVVRADWSHNQGLAGSFWPYTLYRYDAASDAYQTAGMVDAWEKAFAESDSAGNAFPDEIDASRAGIVYYIMENGVYETVSPVDQSAYDAWYARSLSGASPLDIPFSALTEENIALWRA